jgi:hypothetical protein
LTADTNVDFRDLPMIARDRSAAGRAKLFALLAALLVSRWDMLKSGEREQLAGLVALLWPRGSEMDRQRVSADLGGKADLPPDLRFLLQPGQFQAGQPIPPETSLTAKPSKKQVRIVVTHHPIVVKRKPAAPQPAAETDPPAAQIPTQAIVAARDELSPSGLSPAQSTIIADAILTGDAVPMTGTPTPVISSTPRENPHHLTPAHLTEVLEAGDLARFEVMLAQLTKVRAPLLRRLLRDSGNEGLAILIRSLGPDPEAFQRQWQSWRQQMSKLDPIRALPDRHEARQITTFFAALSDAQVDRLIQRWRNDSDGFFASAATST